MSGLQYTITAYAIGLSLLLGYAAHLWWAGRRLAPLERARTAGRPPQSTS
jgi:hypothetical protein